jgi:hypothetical protein
VISTVVVDNRSTTASYIAWTNFLASILVLREIFSYSKTENTKEKRNGAALNTFEPLCMVVTLWAPPFALDTPTGREEAKCENEQLLGYFDSFMIPNIQAVRLN